MPNNRIIPTLAIAVSVPLWAWAQPGPSAPASHDTPAAAPAGSPAKEPPTEAERLLDAAITQVAGRDAVAANLLEKVTMLGQRFEIKGRFLKAPRDRVYLLLEVSGLADSQGKMLQVSDGETLWDYQQVFETQIFHKFKLGPILEKLRSPDLDPALRDQVIKQLGLAGPEMLLTGLREAIKFDQKPEASTLDGKAVWILRGTWLHPEGLTGPNQPQQQIGPLPSFIPSLVTVHLGREDCWPYKVVLVGRPPSILMEDTRPIGPDGRRIGSIKLIQKPLVTRIELIYSDVTFDATPKDEEFAFTAPSGVPVEDGTDTLVNYLEQALEAKAAQKKAEASAAPLLDQAIDVPKAEPSGTEPPPALPR